MTTQKDFALVNFIVASTENGTIRWEATAGNSFVASLKGDHTVVIDTKENEPDTLYLRNREGQVILSIDATDYHVVGRLFELARRNAYDVDTVIDEIMGGEAAGQKPQNPQKPKTTISDEDIPF
jgi:hypothetical protein